MTYLARDIYINVDPQEITDYVGNPHNATKWYAGIVETRSEYDYPVVGSSVQQVYTAAGVRFELTSTLTEFEPGQSWEYQLDGMITGRIRFDCFPEDTGTRLKAAVDYEMAGGALGKIIDRLVVERMNATQLETSLQNLKDTLEFAQHALKR